MHGFESLKADWRFVVAIGDNRVRAAAYARAEVAGGTPAMLIHPTATVLGDVEILPGSHICARAVIGTAVRIGRDVIVNTGAIVDHDVVVEDHAFLAPGIVLAGRVRSARVPTSVSVPKSSRVVQLGPGHSSRPGRR